ncbi:unnamed protein product [Adineta steineri]|uniref:Uncharacterized protein n=1 Tax=Adineta steineri TaxID=433720 RepID=A0A815Y913_9BILA|nr:unnamed protein product [Adineta steineri]CAF1566801.1 unnamed protein product [Adineta steineri]CAF1567121.1 unnamed protein product [Adineta steineri]
MLRQTSLLHRVYHVNIARQTFAPFSTSVRCLADPVNKESSTSTSSKQDIDEGRSFDSVPVHLGSLAKLVMVMGGLYSRVGDVPDTIPNRVYQKTKDRFRARCVVASLFGTGLLALIAAMRGKSAQKEGKRFTDDVYKMHRGESRLHDQLESMHRHKTPSERYSPPVDEINK